MAKTLIISGASSGIGLAIAQKFAQENYQVFNLDIKTPDAIEKKDSAHINDVICDVKNHEQVLACVDKIASSHGIDVLVCNAGMHMSANIEQTDEQSFIDLFNLNVKGAYSLTQAALKHMKQAGGSIIYLASEQSLVAKPNSFAYNLSKHALASMAKTTALDYAKYNIRANALCPGTIDTPLYQKAISMYCASSGIEPEQVHKEEAQLQPLGRIGRAEEVAAFAYFLASDEASFITGSLQVMDGGYSAQ
ncbi:SDR family NAD(P)-dependent oxidoreductase [Ningiella sp. W23]|uniref:SDR family NAD(P)-dependent oxidoreductase n=1 Tax=Ningiella sp. W23 TaxID=3023715 RepID=UPI0037571E97